MQKIAFDPREEGGLELARAVVLQRLRNEPDWNQYNAYSDDFGSYVEYIGDMAQGQAKFRMLVHDVQWELIVHGIIAPGLNSHNPNLPFFHVTDYGRKVLSASEYVPHDPTGYLARFRSENPNADPTVDAYLSESINCFTRGSVIASVVMLGVASERAFLILCEAFHAALADPTEKSRLEKIMQGISMKSKMIWVTTKIQAMQNSSPRSLPDNVTIMLTTVFDFIRCQRNELGHPQTSPPKVTRDDAFVNLRVFPTYYKMLNQVVEYLRQNPV